MLETKSYVDSTKSDLFDRLCDTVDLHFVEAVNLARYTGDPIGFCRQVIGIEPTADQQQILQAVLEHGHVAVRSGHGIGKSTCLAALILWQMSSYPFAKVPATAPTGHQLYDVLMGELVRLWRQMKEPWRGLFDYTSEKFFHKKHRESWAVFPRTARPENPEALQGFHGENMMFVVDEASGVHDKIFEVAQGALTSTGNRVVLTGNPTRSHGFFYDAFHTDRDRWCCLHFSSVNSPLVSPEFVERMRRRYGEDSNIFRIRVMGEFPQAEDDQLIPLSLLEDAMNREPTRTEGRQVWGVDVARFGDDETVVAKRMGDVVTEIRTVRGLDTMEVAGWVVSQIHEGLWPPDTIFVDSTGLGAGVADRLRELGYCCQDVDAGRRSTDPDKYFNLRAELWVRFRDWLMEGAGFLPMDNELISQASAIHYSFDSSGRIKIERKEDLKKRGQPSPDRADAVALTFYRGGLFINCDLS